jgi:hypothetical protein
VGSETGDTRLWERPWWQRVLAITLTAGASGAAIFFFLRARSTNPSISLIAALLLGALVALDRLANALGVPISNPASAPSPENQRIARRLRVAEYVAIGILALGVFVAGLTQGVGN